MHLDELMLAVRPVSPNRRRPNWGIVTAGCAALFRNATSACIAGSDPEKMQRHAEARRLKNEVIIPLHSRNVYDHAVRMTGVNIIEIGSPEQLESAINARTAMIMSCLPRVPRAGR